MAVEHFQIYLSGALFTIYTDHKALLSLDKLKTANARLTRWSLFLQSFMFDVRYRAGRLNTNADALSRQEFEPDKSQQNPPQEVRPKLSRGV